MIVIKIKDLTYGLWKVFFRNNWNLEKFRGSHFFSKLKSKQLNSNSVLFKIMMKITQMYFPTEDNVYKKILFPPLCSIQYELLGIRYWLILRNYGKIEKKHYKGWAIRIPYRWHKKNLKNSQVWQLVCTRIKITSRWRPGSLSGLSLYCLDVGQVFNITSAGSSLLSSPSSLYFWINLST